MVATASQCGLASAALLAHLADKKKSAKLFNEEDTIWMQVTLKKPPPKQLKVKKIPLPYPNQDGAEVCLITKEPGKDVKAKLKAAGVMNISKVISLSKLRKEYKSFKLKSELSDQYDSFIVDDRVYNLVLKTLGKAFNKSAREPLPICLTYPNLKTEVDKTLLCSVFKIAHGHTSVLRVGHSGLSPDELSANVTHAAKLVAEKVPGGAANLRGLHIKSSLSVALPIYQDVSHLQEKEAPAGATQPVTATPPAVKKTKKSKASTLETPAVAHATPQTKKNTSTAALKKLPATDKPRKTAKRARLDTNEVSDVSLAAQVAALDKHATESVLNRIKDSAASVATLATTPATLKKKKRKRETAEE